MKKILIYGLSLALVLSLTACHKSEPEQPTEPTATPAATGEPVQEPTVSPEPTADTTPEKLTSTTPAASTEPENTQPMEDAEPQEPVEEVQLFTDCNETVYATGTVNLRSSWSAESEKLGSLNKGDSVTRTGISIEGTEAEGWSRIQLSDGRIVYVSNKYLSATKPTTQSSGGGGSTTQTKPQGQQGQQGQTQQPTGSQQPTGGQTSQNKDGWDQSFYDTLTPEQKAVYEGLSASSRNQMKNNILNQREREANGWTVDHGDPTEEDLKNAWSNIQMG